MTTNNKNNTISWLDYPPYNVRLRLAQCQTTKGDLSILLDAKWQWVQDTGHYRGCSKDDILVDILDLLDCNGLNSITELTTEEWRNLVKQNVKINPSGFGKCWS